MRVNTSEDSLYPKMLDKEAKVYYVGKEHLPEGIDVVVDNELAFYDSIFTGDDVIKSILANVEEGEYLDATRFTDRFGTALYYSELSTGAKTLINIYTQPDKVFVGYELGNNAMQELFKIPNGNVLLREWFEAFQQCKENLPIKVNGVECYGLYDMEDVIYGKNNKNE